MLQANDGEADGGRRSRNLVETQSADDNMNSVRNGPDILPAFLASTTDFGKSLSDSSEIRSTINGCESETSPRVVARESRSHFDEAVIESITQDLLRRTLAGVSYEPRRCRDISHELAGRILDRIISSGLSSKRYKLVIFVSIGSLSDRPGVMFGSRCLWAAETDTLITVRYSNDSLFAVAMVYGFHRD